MSEQLQDTQPQSKVNRLRFWIMGGSAVLIIVLLAAGYLAGTLMNGRGLFSNHGGEDQPPQITPAPELPTVQADVQGMFVSRSGNSFTIGTGNFGINFPSPHSGTGSSPQGYYDGPTYEVVITGNTKIYQDTTPLIPGPIQQTVAPGNLDDLLTTTTISVWGRKTSDRYVADVIFYQQAVTKDSSGPHRINP